MSCFNPPRPLASWRVDGRVLKTKPPIPCPRGRVYPPPTPSLPPWVARLLARRKVSRHLGRLLGSFRAHILSSSCWTPLQNAFSSDFSSKNGPEIIPKLGLKFNKKPLTIRCYYIPVFMSVFGSVSGLRAASSNSKNH